MYTTIMFTFFFIVLFLEFIGLHKSEKYDFIDTTPSKYTAERNIKEIIGEKRLAATAVPNEVYG